MNSGGAILASALLLIAVMPVGVVSANAEETPDTIWDGVFTEEQALRGKEEYVRGCASCHGGALIPSNEDYPGLVGPPFEYSWHGQTLAERLERIHSTMPYNAPGSLSLEVTADILAYILEFNGYPAGESELDPASELLDEIVIEPPTEQNGA